MGLEMYAFTTAADIPDVDFDRPQDSEQIAYWWKHPNLHGWMEELYHRKGGRHAEFNVSQLRLDTEDIDALEDAVSTNSLPHTVGCFFGVSHPDREEDDLAFIRLARDALGNGLNVFYTSWW